MSPSLCWPMAPVWLSFACMPRPAVLPRTDSRARTHAPCDAIRGVCNEATQSKRKPEHFGAVVVLKMGRIVGKRWGHFSQPYWFINTVWPTCCNLTVSSLLIWSQPPNFIVYLHRHSVATVGWTMVAEERGDRNPSLSNPSGHRGGRQGPWWLRWKRRFVCCCAGVSAAGLRTCMFCTQRLKPPSVMQGCICMIVSNCCTSTV